MKAHPLTAPQQAQAKTHAAAVAAARLALQNATKTHVEFLQTSAGVKANIRVQLSDDGTMVIVG